MAGKSKKPRAKRPRDPTWRARRALGAKRVESAKAYRRADRRRETDEAADEATKPDREPQ